MRELEIVTSAFTITEVLYPKGGKPLPQSVRTKIRRFFLNPGIVLVNVDRAVAENAQGYFWEHNIRPKDAVHVASAVYAGVPVFETYDDKLIALSGAVGDDPRLMIREPRRSSVSDANHSHAQGDFLNEE
ncbi:MAG TPA: PIN domain-containing protein [Longimicrobium sp.]|nr:PIN domain-containing protein [Longimicrobium sp.]